MLEKNLEFINNPDLVSRLRTMKLEESRWDISYCIAESQDYVILKNEIPMDDLKNPREAVREMLINTIKQEMNPNDIIVTFGIGLCYLLDETFNMYPSKIFIYEPDTKLLHFVLSNVDISEHLSSGRVFIYDNQEELLKKLEEVYLTKDKVEVVYLKNYAIVKSNELIEFTQKVYEVCKTKMVDVTTILKYTRTWLFNTLKNISTINSGNAYKLSDLEDKFVGQTALIAAAGPSLKENIEKIKANRNKFVLFAVNKTLRILQENEITPDFVVALDPENIAETYTGLDNSISNTNCIMDLRSEPVSLSKPFRKTFISFAQNDSLIKKLMQYNPEISTYETGGSTAIMALVTAERMGFSKVIFAGLDLAFKGNEAYASGETAAKTGDGNVIVESESNTKELVKVVSVTGEDVETRGDYATFIKHFESIIKELDLNNVYNTTSFGAKINGMKNVQFDNIDFNVTANTTAIILGEVQPFKIQTKEWIEEELALINRVIELLSKGSFSPALISTIVKSSLMYQYLQAEVLKILQSPNEESLIDNFLSETKSAVKYVIETLQKNHLI